MTKWLLLENMYAIYISIHFVKQECLQKNEIHMCTAQQLLL